MAVLGTEQGRGPQGSLQTEVHARQRHLAPGTPAPGCGSQEAGPTPKGLGAPCFPQKAPRTPVSTVTRAGWAFRRL